MGIYGELTESEIKEIILNCRCKVSEFRSFLETGTYKGHSVHNAAYIFPDNHTIEINPQLYNEARKNGEDLKLNNVTYYLADTTEILPQLVKNVIKTPCFWFLDAHQSGPDTTNNGVELVPLMTELDCILRNLKKTTELDLEPNIFVIDDLRLFSKYDDWKHVTIQNILNIFEKYNKKVLIKLMKNDRFIIRI